MQPDRREFLLGSLAASMLSTPALAALAPETMKGAPPPPLKGLIRKAYADSTWGQIHYRYVAPKADAKKTPVVFFHPNPFSGAYFNYSMEELGKDRMAIAFDSPGYGESAKPPKPQSMEAICDAFGKALDNMGYGKGKKGQVDVSGFHTGGYIAPELAAQRPDLVRRVVLSGVPFWEGERLDSKRKELLHEEPITEDGAFFALEWKRWAAGRNKMLSIDRGLELAADAVIPGKDIWYAYYAVCNYEARKRFPLVKQPTYFVIPSGEEMQITTRLAVPVFPNVKKVLEVPQLPHQIFDLAVDAVGQIYREFLDGPA